MIEKQEYQKAKITELLLNKTMKLKFLEQIHDPSKKAENLYLLKHATHFLLLHRMSKT